MKTKTAKQARSQLGKSASVRNGNVKRERSDEQKEVEEEEEEEEDLLPGSGGRATTFRFRRQMRQQGQPGQKGGRERLDPKRRTISASSAMQIRCKSDAAQAAEEIRPPRSFTFFFRLPHFSFLSRSPRPVQFQPVLSVFVSLSLSLFFHPLPTRHVGPRPKTQQNNSQ